MKCHLVLVKNETFACSNEGCGRILKIVSKKPSSLSLDCKGMAARTRITDHLRESAMLIAVRDVIAGDPPSGPGVKMRELAASLGFSQGGCGCAATESRMNWLGPKGCRTEMESLVDEVLKNAKKKGVDITRDTARHLILESCRLYEVENATPTAQK